MALRAKIRGTWRNVSPAMARVFRAHGVDVIDTDAVTPSFRARPDERIEVSVTPVGAIGDLLEQKIDQPSDVDLESFQGTAATLAAEIAFTDAATATDSAPRIRKCSVCGEPGHTKAKCPRAHADDLSDAELEKLTAPDEE